MIVLITWLWFGDTGYLTYESLGNWAYLHEDWLKFTPIEEVLPRCYKRVGQDQ